MKVPLFAVSTLALLLLGGCSPNPTVQGKPLSEWVTMLSDRDSTFREVALNAIAKVKPAEAKRAKDALVKMANNPDESRLMRGRASALLVNNLNYRNVPIFDLLVCARLDNTDWSIFASRSFSCFQGKEEEIVKTAAKFVSKSPLSKATDKDLLEDANIQNCLEKLGPKAAPFIRVEAKNMDANSLGRQALEMTAEKLDEKQ